MRYQVPLSPSQTSLEQELLQQKLWLLKPQFKGFDKFSQLLQNEFISREDHLVLLQNNLKKLVRFCSRNVPYYKDLFRKVDFHRFNFEGIEDLQKIPMLTKSTVQQQSATLHAGKLPLGERIRGVAKTSGSTGQPLEVLQSETSTLMFSLLKQRELRWFRWDPHHVMAALRPAKDLPMGPEGDPIKLGQTCRLKGWHRVGYFFETAPFYGFQRANPIEEQKKWLAALKPAYLVGHPADLEMLALAYQGENTPASLKGFHAIAQEITDDMQMRIENTFKVPVHVNYGLNEVGIVATRCPEGGRYHVHSEHCLVEIINEEGRLCKPGDKGRILVTSLTNYAMPLLRYDTDDLAEAVEGPCPCGRTLPSFGRIHGRYRRLVSLPPGVMDYFIALQHKLGDLPSELTKNLRQYQLHHFRDGRFELRTVVAAPLPPGFRERIMEKWVEVEEQDTATLHIVEVAEIPRPPGGKFQNFTSDFMPVPPASNR
jgi:phenylacetate-CoA ligase